MQLSCIHCGQEFSITADQLGGRGRCPHCHGEIELPKASDEGGDQVHAAFGEGMQRPLRRSAPRADG